jgi:hypothetical protein
MFFKLCNASSTFQNYINNFLRKYLDYFVIVYLNDVLIFSAIQKKHIEHVLKILRRLRKKDLQINIDKCEFFVFEVKHLNMIVEVNDVKMNLKKMISILKWQIFTSVKMIQFFLEFANFYRRFIEKFFAKVKCITKLTREEQYVTRSERRRTQYQNFKWTDECQKTCEDMKEAFIIAFILTHYDSILKIWLKTDVSDFAISKMLFQMHDNVL